MGRIARRGFLIGSAAILGGVAFGTWAVVTPHDNPLDPGDGATFNPWVKLTPGGVTLIVPHVDLGQGAASMQAMLIAEEMDLAMDGFATDPGPPAPAYWNTAMADDALPFLPTDRGTLAQAARGAAGAAIKLMGVQLTGGSTSTADSFDKLRMAGAVARETIKEAAARRTGMDRAALGTQDGAVVLPDGGRIPYTDLAADTADIDPVTDVALRDPSQWRLIGHPVERIDMAAKSTGRQIYGIDLAPEGMLHATVRMSPRRGTLDGFDVSAAITMRGVRDILEIPGGVAVVADNTWRAFRAIDAIRFDWGPAPYPADQADHWAGVAASFGDDRLDREWLSHGDVDAAMQADAITAEYRAPYVAHQPLEPLSATIRMGDGVVDIWVSHQMPRFVQDRVAAITGVDADAVRLHNQYAGGSFGHRLEFGHVDAAAEIAMRLPGETIKLTYSREEDFAQDFPRQIGMARARGAVAGGHIVALDLRIATASASRSQLGRLGQSVPGPDAQIVAGAWTLPYAIPDFRVRAYAVPDLAPTSSWRSVGASTGGFFADCFVDELCHAAGADPLAERLALCTDPDARACLRAVGEMSGWGRAMAPGQGMGVAFVSSFGVPVAEVVQVRDTDAGIVIEDVWVAAEVGRVVDPVNFENNVQGGVAWGLGHAMNAEITYAGGMAEQTNFHAHAGMRLHQCPRIHVRALENGDRVRGIGEPPVPPAAPALANAIFAATGQRIREMPFARHVRFA